MAIKRALRGDIPPFIVMDILRAANARAAAGADIVHLELGEPAAGAPEPVLTAVRAALETGRLGYTEALGIAPLRARIAAWYGERYGVTVPPERIVVTTGSSGGFVLAFLAAFDAGDRVALADPSYPAYRNILAALDIVPLGLASGAAERYQPTIRQLEALDPPPDGLIVASPSNPAGTMLAPDELGALAAYCRERGIRLISDEIYHGITYGRPQSTALAVSDQAVVINSFSKYFAMTGWRIGWMVVPEDLHRSVECLAQNIFISPPTLSQHAALAALDCAGPLDRVVAEYAEKRGFLLDALPAVGFDRLAPADGAFYLYADVRALTNDSEAFCKRMLEEIGIAMVPGTDFDRGRGRGFVRISFAGSHADMEEAVRRLQRWER